MTLHGLVNSSRPGQRIIWTKSHLRSPRYLSACPAQPLAHLPESAASQLLSWVLVQITRLGSPKPLCTLHILLPSEPRVTSSCPPVLPHPAPQLPSLLFPSPSSHPHPSLPLPCFSSFLWSSPPNHLQVPALSTREADLGLFLALLKLAPHLYISETCLCSASGPL